MSSSVAAQASSAAAPAPAVSSASASARASASASVAPAPSSVAASSAASSAAAPAASSAASSSAAAASVAASSSASAASSSAAASSSSASVASSSAPAPSSSASQTQSSSIASSSSSSSRKPTSSNTTNTNSQSNMTSPNSPSSLSTGAIIGIVVGVVSGLVLIALFWRWCKRRKDNKLPKAPLPPPRDPTSMRQRAPGGGGGSGSVSGMNRASSYSTLLGPTAYAQSHSRQPSLSDSLPLHSGISPHHLQQKSSMSSLNKVDEHMPSPDGFEPGLGIRPSPLPTPSESSHGSRTNSPYPPSDFMPPYPRQGPASSLSYNPHRPEWQRSSISSLSSSAAGGSYGVTHTGKLVSVQMPKRLGAPKPDENGDFFSGNRGRVPSGIARWRDDLQAPSMNHTRTPSTLSFNSPAVSSSEGSDSAEHALKKERER